MRRRGREVGEACSFSSDSRHTIPLRSHSTQMSHRLVRVIVKSCESRQFFKQLAHLCKQRMCCPGNLRRSLCSSAPNLTGQKGPLSLTGLVGPFQEHTVQLQPKERLLTKGVRKVSSSSSLLRKKGCLCQAPSSCSGVG